MPRFDFDLIVIGAGAAGLTASGFGALMGAKTALIEAERLGGDCTWTGCIPSKTLLKAARVVHQIGTAERYGLKLSPQARASENFDFSVLMEHVRRLQQQVYEQADAPPNLERLGVEVISGSARFLDPHSLQIESEIVSRKLSARFIVIADRKPCAGSVDTAHLRLPGPCGRVAGVTAVLVPLARSIS